jgi:DNA-binding LacI/PurR family transcriptional regulator
MPRTERPSLAEIAAAIGVSAMTVSYALRGSRQVSPAMRQRVLHQAEHMGYRPDPLLTHLMSHVRNRRIRHTQATLGVLTFKEDNYTTRLVAGVEARARHLGYAIDKVAAEPFARNPARLTQLLQARGIAGLLLPPTRAPESVVDLLDWSQFASVAMTYSVREPQFHRVVPHHFHNAMLVVRELAARGYRRPAFVIHRSADLRANHALTGALACVRENNDAPPPRFAADHDLTGLVPWCRRQRPDALVFSGVTLRDGELIERLTGAGLKDVGLAVMDYDYPCYKGVAGINQKAGLIGATAVDLLVAQLHRHERGVPRDPVVSMVEGSWVSDRSVRQIRV